MGSLTVDEPMEVAIPAPEIKQEKKEPAEFKNIKTNARADKVVAPLEARRLLSLASATILDKSIPDEEFELEIVKIDKPAPVVKKPSAKNRNQQLMQLAYDQLEQKREEEEVRARQLLEKKREEKEERRREKEAFESLKESGKVSKRRVLDSDDEEELKEVEEAKELEASKEAEEVEKEISVETEEKKQSEENKDWNQTSRCKTQAKKKSIQSRKIW